MTHDMSYSTQGQYLPTHPQYYPSTDVHHPVHVPPTSTRPEIAAQRKRPKYTRSKTGCMTCRVKKIKCDETKPNCMRCTHGSRECTWPEGAPARKKTAARRDSLDERPSTAGSSGLSEASSPPTREHTPPRRQPNDLNLLPLPSRPSDAFANLPSVNPEHESSRRQLERSSSYTHTNTSNASNLLSMIPESQYSSRYDHNYLAGSNATNHSRHGIAAYHRTLSHPSSNHWGSPSDPLDPYYHGHHGLHDRGLLTQF